MAKRANATSYGQKAGNKPNTTKPGTGRLPDIFKKRMSLLASRAATVRNVEKILQDHKHPSFMKALEFAAERGFGKEATTLEGDITIRVVREESPPSA